MLSRAARWSLLACLFWPAVASGAAPTDLPARVRTLVLQLNDPDLTTRQAAEQALTELGSEALPLLPPVTPQMPAEAQERLVRVRGKLEQALVAESLQPSRVTLRGELTLSEALERIQQRTGNRLQGYAGRAGKVTLNLTDALFWEAVDEVLDQAGLDINPFAGQAQTLVLAAKPSQDSPRRGQATYSGPFRLEVTRLEARRDLRSPEMNTLRITLEIAWEPRLAPISLRQRVDALQVVDDGGRDLVPLGRGGVWNASVESGISSVEIAMPLPLPPRGAQRLTRLRGTAEALMPGHRETFTFFDLENARDVQQRKAAVRVTLERWRKNLDVYEARIRLRYDHAGAALDSHRGWFYRNKAYLLDANNQRVEEVGTQLLHQGPNELGLAYLFDLEGSSAGCRFVYETPAIIELVPVHYEFLNIALP